MLITQLVDGSEARLAHGSFGCVSREHPEEFTAHLGERDRMQLISACQTVHWPLGQSGFTDGCVQPVIKGPSGAGIRAHHFHRGDRVTYLGQHKFQHFPVLTRRVSIAGQEFRFNRIVCPREAADMLRERPAAEPVVFSVLGRLLDLLQDPDRISAATK